MAGRGTRATDLLARLKIAYTVHSYEHDPRGGAYGLEAAAALGVPPERVFKTLVAEVDERLTVAVVPVAGSLDLKALAGAAGGKEANQPALVGYRSTARPMARNNCDPNSFACIVYVIAVMPSSPRGQQVRPAWPAWLTPLCAGPVAFELQSRAIAPGTACAEDAERVQRQLIDA